MNEGKSLLLCKLECIITSLIIYIAVEYNLCTIALSAVNLHKRCCDRHYDNCADSVELRCISYALCMVSR